MYGLQPTHILLVVIVAVIFFMPQRLPELTRSIGRMFSEFRDGVKEEPQPQKSKDTSRDAQ